MRCRAQIASSGQHAFCASVEPSEMDGVSRTAFITRGLCLSACPAELCWTHCQVRGLQSGRHRSSKNTSPCLGRNSEGSSGSWLENFRGECGSQTSSFDWCQSHWMGVSISARRTNFRRTRLRLFFTVIIYWTFQRPEKTYQILTWFSFNCRENVLE